VAATRLAGHAPLGAVAVDPVAGVPLELAQGLVQIAG
jgi:hypothetical protein